jgi:hypothetical protein
MKNVDAGQNLKKPFDFFSFFSIVQWRSQVSVKIVNSERMKILIHILLMIKFIFTLMFGNFSSQRPTVY